MSRTKHGLPGIHNASPITLPDGAGAALALNASGQLIVDTSGGGGAGDTVVTGPDATGAPPTQNPVFIAGVDTNGDIAPIKTVAGHIQSISEQLQGQPLSAYGTIIVGMDPDASALPPLVDDDGAWLMTSQNVTPANRSGTITTGGTAQQLMASNTRRRGYWVQNNSAGDLWINDLGTATAAQPSLKLEPGDYYESPMGGAPVGAISIIGATLGQTFSAREW